MTTTQTTTPANTTIDFVTHRNAHLNTASADQAASLKSALALYVYAFPTVAEISAIVTANGGMKIKGEKLKENKNTTLLLYIAQAGEETFSKLWDSYKVKKADELLPLDEVNDKRATHVLSVYAAMITVDKYADCISDTAKFTRKPA